VEALGDPGPAVDAEIIELATRFYAAAGLVSTTIYLNSIGDAACRPAYIAELAAFYRSHLGELPDFEKGRLERAPLRLLDSKDARLVALNRDAPKITEHLCDACAAHFASVRAHLDAVGVQYTLNPYLVRGLDYYTRTAFEAYPAGDEGQQSALGGGGRYDGLIELLGGRPTPGIGFGLGLDRVLLALDKAGVERAPEPHPVAVVVSSDPADTVTRFRIATELRGAGLAARAELGTRKLGKQLEAAARDGAHFAVIIGDELAGGHIQLRDLQAGTQRAVEVASLARELERAAKSHHHGVGES
jgi:histidyl-tRNA synthetase